MGRNGCSCGDDTDPKPAIEPFELAMDRLHATSKTTVHAGDSLETDVRGVTAAGIRSVRVSSDRCAEEYEPDYRVNSVSDLEDPPWRV